MKERPILFSAPMVRALLDGRKTQTRRIVPERIWEKDFFMSRNRFGAPGDRLWVRETWQGYWHCNYEGDGWEQMESPKDRHERNYIPVYRADGKSFPDKWFPAIHMPREFSRITLEIVSVHVERLQDISEEDAIAEGVEYEIGGDDGSNPLPPNGGFRDYLSKDDDHSCEAVASYCSLWQSINGPGSWDANPWVWVIEFRRIANA